MGNRSISVQAVATRLGIPVEEVQKLERRGLLHATVTKDGVAQYSSKEVATILSGAGVETREAAAKIGIVIQKNAKLSLAKKLALIMCGEVLCFAVLLGGRAIPQETDSISTILTPVVLRKDSLSQDVINGLKIAATGNSTLSIAEGKALIANSTLALDGADGATIVFQGSDVYVGRNTVDVLTNKTLSAGANAITGLTNANLNGAAAISNANLANSGITLNTAGALAGGGVVTLGGALTLTCPSCAGGSGGTLFTASASSGSDSTILQGGTLVLAAGSNLTTTNNGSGTITIASSTTPSFTTVNGLTITNTGANTLTIAAGKTLTASNTLTFTGTDGTSFALPTASDTLVGRASTDTLTNKTVNGLTFTANAVGFSIAGGTTSKTLTLNNTLTLAGVDSSALTFQGTDTYVGRATTDTLTNKTLTAPAINGTVNTTGLTLPGHTVAGNMTGSGSPTISSFGAINGLTLTAASDGLTIAGGTTSRTVTVTGADITIGSTVKPTSAGALAVQSNGANTLTFDTGGAAALNIGTTNANGLSIGRSGVTTSIAGTADANNLKIGSGTTITKHLSGTATFNAASIALGSCANIGTITVTGAAVGDSVTAAPTAVAGGIETLLLAWSAYVSATDTVTIRACSVATIGGQDAANQTWRADIWQH